MTTKVLITCPAPAHQRVRVDIQHRGFADNGGIEWHDDGYPTILDEAESAEFHVYPTQRLVITEVARNTRP